MKLNSIAGIVCYAKDLSKTAAFYEKLGFIIEKNDEAMVVVRVNWFWIEFVPVASADTSEFEAEATAWSKGAGQYVYIKVDDVDGAYKELVAAGLKTSSEPRDWSWGRREFVIRDPDGYKLVFYQKIK